MLRLSSNITLILRIFIPTAWLSFFGLFLFVIFIADTSDLPFLGSTLFKSIFVVMFLLFFALIYFTLWQLKRVESDGKYMYITDYFKTVRYPIDDVEKIKVTNLGIIQIGNIRLKEKGLFGQKIPFVIKRSNFDDFRKHFPHFFQ